MQYLHCFVFEKENAFIYNRKEANIIKNDYIVFNMHYIYPTFYSIKSYKSYFMKASF